MSLSCSQCSFTAKFESALLMHRQLHHDQDATSFQDLDTKPIKLEKANTVPRTSLDLTYQNRSASKPKLGRTSSATRLLGKLRAKICRSKTLFPHPEENLDVSLNNANENCTNSECTSKAFNMDVSPSRSTALSCAQIGDQKDVFSCHLCTFDADRITVLDRHLLNDHKIGLENLLKLVMTKTQEGLHDETIPLFGVRQPYYKQEDEIIDTGEFVIETVSPKIKILKHTASNTDIKWSELVKGKEIPRMAKIEADSCSFVDEKEEILDKMQTLNECMCKFVDSTNTLKKVLAKEYESARTKHSSCESPMFQLGLGTGDKETSREWDSTHSDALDRCRNKYKSKSTCEKQKMTSESFYF